MDKEGLEVQIELEVEDLSGSLDFYLTVSRRLSNISFVKRIDLPYNFQIKIECMEVKRCNQGFKWLTQNNPNSLICD